MTTLALPASPLWTWKLKFLSTIHYNRLLTNARCSVSAETVDKSLITVKRWTASLCFIKKTSSQKTVCQALFVQNVKRLKLWNIHYMFTQQTRPKARLYSKKETPLRPFPSLSENFSIFLFSFRDKQPIYYGFRPPQRNSAWLYPSKNENSKVTSHLEAMYIHALF